MKLLICYIIALFVLALAPAMAQNQTRIYDSRGNSIGTATRDSQGTTVFRNSRGTTTGTATTNSQGTTFYDSRGSVTGRTSR